MVNEFYIPKSIKLYVLHVRNKKYEFSAMSDGRYVEFGRSVIRAMLADNHLGDFSCLAGSDRPTPKHIHHFANGTSGQELD